MELSQCAILAQAISLKVALLSRVHLLFWCVCVCVCIHVNVHGTPWMAGHRGAAGVVQCDPSASSGFGAVATGTELPSASEDAQCVSCVALLLCSSGSITVRKSGPPPHSRGGHRVHAVVQHSWSQPCSCWMLEIPR